LRGILIQPTEQERNSGVSRQRSLDGKREFVLARKIRSSIDASDVNLERISYEKK
jgi:hypothetical protein